MPSLRRSASSAPRSPLATAVSAVFKMRSFSDAEYFFLLLFGTLSSDVDAFTLGSRCSRSPSFGEDSRPGTANGLGTYGIPFSAHHYRDIEK